MVGARGVPAGPVFIQPRPRACARRWPGSTRAAAAAQSLTASAAAGRRADGRLDGLRHGIGGRLEAESPPAAGSSTAPAVDLAVMNRPFAATSAPRRCSAVGALIWAPVMRCCSVASGRSGPSLALRLALRPRSAFFLPDLALRQEAERRRRDFRHVVGSFLDLVAMNLAGGRGLPEALMAASTHRRPLGDGPDPAGAGERAHRRHHAVGGRSPGSARTSASRSCATWPRRSRSPVTRAPRSGRR